MRNMEEKEVGHSVKWKRVNLFSMHQETEREPGTWWGVKNEYSQLINLQPQNCACEESEVAYS